MPPPNHSPPPPQHPLLPLRRSEIICRCRIRTTVEVASSFLPPGLPSPHLILLLLPSTLTFPTKKDGSHQNGHHRGSPNSTSSSFGDSRGRSSQNGSESGKFTAFDVITALVAEDLSRQQARQAQYLHGVGHGHGHNGNGAGGSANGTRTSPLALGKIDTLADLLPLRSTLFDSCAEYYSEPQMKVSHI